MLFCVFVEEVHHAVGDHVAPVFDTFVLVEGGEDEAYVVFFEAVRYWDLDAFFIDVGSAVKELLVRSEVLLDCAGGYVLPIDGLSQGERYEIACDGEVSVFERGAGHARVRDAFPFEPL